MFLLVRISSSTARYIRLTVYIDEGSRNKKKQLNESELALRREETARKRKNLSEKKLEDEKVSCPSFTYPPSHPSHSLRIRLKPSIAYSRSNLGPKTSGPSLQTTVPPLRPPPARPTTPTQPGTYRWTKNRMRRGAARPHLRQKQPCTAGFPRLGAPPRSTQALWFSTGKRQKGRKCTSHSRFPSRSSRKQHWNHRGPLLPLQHKYRGVRSRGVVR